jgi:hypothetical protein
MVGLSRFELLTPRLSSVCSNQLSYRPSSPSISTNSCQRICLCSPCTLQRQTTFRLVGRSAKREGRFLQNWTGRIARHPAGIRSI